MFGLPNQSYQLGMITLYIYNMEYKEWSCYCCKKCFPNIVYRECIM